MADDGFVLVGASAFVIRELGGDKREVTLTTRALPYRNFELEGEQRLEVTWLPGSPEGSATLLGPKENPSTVNGEWKDKYLGRTDLGRSPFLLNEASVNTASEACDHVDSIRMLGQLLEVTWFNKVRRGFLRKFRQTWRTTHDVAWEMQFEWISQGTAVGAAVFVTDQATLGVFDALTRQMEKLDDVGTPGNFPLHQSVLGFLQGIQRGISDLVGNIQDTVQNLADKVLSPVRAVRGIIATLSGIKDECAVLVEYLNGQVAGALNASVPVPAQTYSERLSAAQYREELKAWAQELERVATEQQAELEAQVSTDVQGTYVAKVGDDLRDVSRLFYGTPFEWRRIMVFNELNSVELTAGQLVLIPTNSGSSSQEDPGG